jgi:anti-sigma B factor antagonist
VEAEAARRGAETRPLVFAAVGSERPDPPIFSLDVAVGDDGCTTILVVGELDLATAEEFSRAVLSGLDTGAVMVDLRGVTFMDSSGVRALNTALRESAERGRQLRVRDGMPPSVVQVLELTGMLGLLPVEGGR